MSRLPERRATLWLGVLVLVMAFSLTILVVLRGMVDGEALGLILGTWLTGGAAVVIGFWFGTSVGGRMNGNKDEPPPPHEGEG